jgi:G patch domain-containing protein 1
MFCIFATFIFYLEARREARKAFLAFSSDDAKSLPEDSEPGEEDHKSILDHQPIDDGLPSSQSTPVRISPVLSCNLFWFYFFFV